MHRDAQSWATDCKSRAQQARRKKKPETRRWVIEKLRAGWSPQQISGRSKVDGPQSVSHEYVYDLVHRDKKDGGKLHRLLKRFGRRKQRLGAREYPVTEFAASRRSIETRPAVVAQRARLGDYEADLIVGYRQSGYVLTVIDRTSLATVLRRVPTKHASEILRELKVALRKLGTARTVTVDNGKEFYAHRELEKSERVRAPRLHAPLLLDGARDGGERERSRPVLLAEAFLVCASLAEAPRRHRGTAQRQTETLPRLLDASRGAHQEDALRAETSVALVT